MAYEKTKYATMSKNIWIADLGASMHMIYSLDGLVKTIECNSPVMVGYEKTLECKKIGSKIGYVQVRKGEFKKLTLEEVKYVPELFCNLLSITKVMQRGFVLRGENGQMWIQKGKSKIFFDQKIKTADRELYGIYIDPEIKNETGLIMQYAECRLIGP